MSWGEDQQRCRDARYLLGLIGNPLSHSFSKTYFNQKFAERHLDHEWYYELFPLRKISELPALMETYPNLIGLNVTIPYKKEVIPYLTQVEDRVTRQIQACNSIVVRDQSTFGFNTDYLGFRESLIQWTNGDLPQGALILGAGGAALGVAAALESLGIPFTVVNRKWTFEKLHSFEVFSHLRKRTSFENLTERHYGGHQLIVNTTPLGTYPNIETCPPIDYQKLNPQHWCYDLVYNPEKTLFLQRAEAFGARTINGYSMLVGQAEAAWKIWNRQH